MKTEEIMWALVVLIGILTIGGLLTLTGLTTHASHMRDLNNKKALITVCLQKNSADSCRILIYGTQ